MKVKENRAWSFAIVGLVYVLAALLGAFVYSFLPFSFWLNLLIADVVATAFTFVFSLIFKNASVYDPYWSVQPIVIVIAFVALKGLRLSGVFLLVAICIWGVRLTANWAYTFHGLTHQDWRYTMLAEKTGEFYPFINFLGIHLVPTLVVYGCVLPAVFVIEKGADFNAGVAVFTLFALAAVCLQGTADVQMHCYRKQTNKTGKRGFIRTGLWKYSRHPNYLGEILMWWSVGLAAVCVLPQYWWLLFGALANTLLFFCVSIPMADRRQAAKVGFSEYKRQTRMLLPIKKSAGM